MKLNLVEVETLIEQAKAADTYICGADVRLCGHPIDSLPFPCQQCERNTHWKNTIPSDDD